MKSQSYSRIGIEAHDVVVVEVSNQMTNTMVNYEWRIKTKYADIQFSILVTLDTFQYDILLLLLNGDTWKNM